MRPCLHNKFGKVVLSTITGGQLHWCRNCGSLIDTFSGDATVPQIQLEKIKTPRKGKIPVDEDENSDFPF